MPRARWSATTFSTHKNLFPRPIIFFFCSVIRVFIVDFVLYLIFRLTFPISDECKPRTQSNNKTQTDWWLYWKFFYANMKIATHTFFFSYILFLVEIEKKNTVDQKKRRSYCLSYVSRDFFLRKTKFLFTLMQNLENTWL